MTNRLGHLSIALLAVVAVLAAGGVATADASVGQPTSAALSDGQVAECAAAVPDDHEDPAGDTANVIGWVDGYWYDEPLDIGDPAALSGEELEALTARTAAQVETIRCLTFEEAPPVELVTREEFATTIEADFAEYFTPDREQFVDAQFAAMLVADQETDGPTLLEEHRTGFAAAFYDPSEEYIGMIGERPEDTEIDQVTFAHELLHALQDQHYNLSAYNRGETTDRHKANLSVVEGEAQFVDYEYEKRCNRGEWVDDCLDPETSTDSPDPVSWELTFWDVQPYTDGYTLVDQQYESDGWEGIDTLFAEPPTSTIHSIYPEKYGELTLPDLTVPDRSDEDWERITFDGESDAERVGQAGITAMLMGPTYDQAAEGSIIDQLSVLGNHERDYLNYDHPETDGWRGDRLYTYQDGTDTGTVWKLAWTDAEEAERFADAYGDLLDIRGATEHDEYANVHTFEEADGWEMAVALEQRDDRLWIVTAPNVDELTGVHEDIQFREATGEENGETDPNGEENGIGDQTADADDGDTDEPGEYTDDDGSGFGVLVGVAGILGVLFLARRRGSAKA